MARIVDISEQTFNRIMQAVKKLESSKTMRGESKVEITKRSQRFLHYIEITSSVDENEYVANVYDNPTDRNLIQEDVTVYAKKHTLGTIPNSSAGKGLEAIKMNDGKYYLIYPFFFAG